MERVIYQNNPIVEAIIQIRFPKILSLNSEDPVMFQEQIKEQYPIYRLSIERQQEISIQSPDTPPSIIQETPVKNHNFISSDGTYKINLTNGFISISTVKYTRWETMLEKFSHPLEQFFQIYNPSFVNRIGLRYINAFSRKKLGLESVSWSQLITPPCLGAFTNLYETNIINSNVNFEYLLEASKSRAKIHAGLGQVEGNPETMFVIDSDFISLNTIAPTAVLDVLNNLHDEEKKFIQSAITDQLHCAMKPEPIK